MPKASSVPAGQPPRRIIPKRKTRGAERRSDRALRGRSVNAREDASAAVLDGLRAVLRELRLAARASEQQVGIHGAQLHALQQLARAPVHSLGELAARTQTDVSTVSVLVSRLVDRGFVDRREAKGDRRRTVLEVTPAGRALVRRAPTSAHSRLEAATAEFSTAKLRMLGATLERLARQLCALEA